MRSKGIEIIMYVSVGTISALAGFILAVLNAS